jgi:hypothetical protein
MLCQRDLHCRIAEFHGLAALGDYDLLARYSQAFGDFGCERRADNRGASLSCDRSDVGDVIEMGVGNEDRIGLRDVRRFESASRAGAICSDTSALSRVNSSSRCRQNQLAASRILSK